VTGRFPVTPVERGSPVALAREITGFVARTLFPVPVLVTLTSCLDAFNANAVDAVRFDITKLELTVALAAVRLVTVKLAAPKLEM
jgi:hypothetical protein